MHLLAVRILAAFFALTWVLFPGFGLVDLSVSWDPDWPVVLEASWGVFMTVLVGGSFAAIAIRPGRPPTAVVTLMVSLAAMVVSAAAGLEWQLLGYAALLAAQMLATGRLLRALPGRETVRPMTWSVRWPLLVVAALGVVPWLMHAGRMYAANRRNAGEIIGELTMGVDHYALQGGLALALVTLALLAACWPRGRRHLALSVSLCAGYLGLVSYAFPAAWAGFSPLWSVLCMAWGLAVAALAVPGSPSEQGQFRGEVVEAERAL